MPGGSLSQCLLSFVAMKITSGKCAVVSLASDIFGLLAFFPPIFFFNFPHIIYKPSFKQKGLSTEEVGLGPFLADEKAGHCLKYIPLEI